mgnify:CR=1 FL=1
MKISTKGRYALRMMVDLAEHQNGEYISLKDIALRQEVSKKYLEQIVPILNKSGFLKTNRGYQGGYMLAKPPRQYTVGDILRLTEGDLAPVPCAAQDPADCPRSGLRHAAGLARAEPRHQRIPRWYHAAGPARPAAGALCQ